MWKRVRRLWARLWHRHVWEIMHRGTVTTTYLIGSPHHGDKKKQHAVLERCYCGKERAYCSTLRGREAISVEWFHAELRREQREAEAHKAEDDA